MLNLTLENLVDTRFICIATKNTSRQDAGMTIHKRIKTRREALGMSMQTLAELCGYSSWQTVQQWEKEESPTAPKRSKIPAVAAALQMTEEQLVFGDEAPKLENIAGSYKLKPSKFKEISVFGRAMGGFPETIFDEDGGWPPGFSDQYAEVASSDPHAFLVPVEGDSMIPRFNPGEYALVEPNTEPEIEDDVLVRLGDGRTLIKRLLSRRGVIRLGSYNNTEIISSPPEDILWMYYVAHPVPARKIKQRG